MTTGRINQVSKDQNFNANAQSFETQNEFTFAVSCAMQKHERKELYFHHRHNGIRRPQESKIQAVNPNSIDIAANGFPLAANRCDQSEFIKSTNTNPQTLYNSEELCACFICILNPAALADPKEETAATQPIEILFQCEDLCSRIQHQHKNARIFSFAASRKVSWTNGLNLAVPTALLQKIN